MYAWTLAASVVIAAAGCAGPLDAPDHLFDAQWGDSFAEAWENESTHVAQIVHGKPAESITLDDSSVLADYLAYAALHNPELEAAFAKWRAALEKLPQVRALPNPMFTYGYFIEEVETRVGPQEHRVRIAQTFPWFGELDLRESLAARAADEAYEHYQAVKLGLFYKVKDAYYERYYLACAIELTSENIGLLEQFEQIARARYRVASAQHPDVIRVQVEVEKLKDRLRSLQDRRTPLTARLNAALNLETGTDLPWPTLIPNVSPPGEDAEVFAALKHDNPSLRALDRRIERHRLAADLARKAYYPDITLGLDYIATGEARMAGTSGSGDDPVIASLTFSVPLWREKYDASVREALASRHAAAKERLGAGNSLVSEAQNVLYNYRDADRQAALFRDTLIPKAEQALEASLTAYQSASGGFIDVLDAERLLLEFQLSYKRAQASRMQMLAKLDMLIGTSSARIDNPPSEGREITQP